MRPNLSAIQRRGLHCLASRQTRSVSSIPPPGNPVRRPKIVPRQRPSSSSSSSRSFSYSSSPVTTRTTLRRPRAYEGKVKVEGIASRFGNLDAPIDYGDDADDYLQNKASLSPWVPVPDVVARKLFDLADATSDDVHVDLGSGDGRVNFHAVDGFNVRKSIGIDSDEQMVNVALERMSKRHPRPTNLDFVVGDLSSSQRRDDGKDGDDTSVWKHVNDATIITMYFATPALQKLRPVLEERLAGRRCRVVTVGYEMPTWRASASEVVLGTQIHLYRFGGRQRGSGSADDDEDYDDDEEDDFLLDGDDSIIAERPEQMLRSALERKEFAGSNVIDHTGKYPIRGYNPNIFDETDEDSDWEDDDDNDEDDDEEEDDEGSKNEDAEEINNKAGKARSTTQSKHTCRKR